MYSYSFANKRGLKKHFKLYDMAFTTIVKQSNRSFDIVPNVAIG
jgi:hypothetical protein